VPLLAGRIDRDKIAAVGDSLGGHTVSLLLGARITDPETGEDVNLIEPRIKAGVLLAAPGRGGDILTGWMAERVPFFHTTDFSRMTTPALIVAGDKDDSRHFTDIGPDWHTDPYRLAPAPKTLLTLFDAEHLLGGISGYDAAETTDENPERVAALARLTSAYLRTQFQLGDQDSWQVACQALTTEANPVGRVESKVGRCGEAHQTAGLRREVPEQCARGVTGGSADACGPSAHRSSRPPRAGGWER
jgi:hypothetical protein